MVGIEPTMRESKSRAFPLGDTPMLGAEVGFEPTIFSS